MKNLIDRYPKQITRFFETILPLTTWFIITLPIWLSPFHPAIVAYFILSFDVYFLYKSLSVTFFSTLSYLKLKKLSDVDWRKKAGELKNFSKVYHTLIITNYMEQTDKVKRTLEYLTKLDFPLKRIIIILAMEEREGITAKDRAATLINLYKNKFGLVTATFHPDINGEVKGKASNSAWAGKEISGIIRKKRINPSYVTVTSCDADSLLSDKYFSYLTYVFLSDPERYFHFYWAPVLLYSNFWEVPLPIRLQATISSIMRLSTLSKSHNLIQISTYSLSLNMLEKIGYWDTNIIPEDWHVFLQAFFKLGAKVKTIPLYLITSRDAVHSHTLLGTFKSRYEQEKRWAWGITDVPYALKKLFTSPHIALLPKLFNVSYVIETHLFWPTSFFILTLGASIPAIMNPVFSRTTLGHNLPRISGLILTITTIFLSVLIFIDTKSRPKRPNTFSIAKTPLLIFQWILLPVVSFFFSSLPALEAHTRLLIGKRLEYKVTEKI
ncbi:hypothetical protein COV53_06965 [Candidatus Gottesmanbacteria bacterium CG11_big_fil_rev_8_21_14_0_20_37_11]|uniref:Glycosyltransferase 2-like domain-containing protein n=3 Tax=Candidatus Gottesmaniibacteriota TaxID=1752720 RepID=A0A2M7RRS0_9BACT|nr:MAG: hypothetical protein AUJ73_01615 [Candidatus Gottesmanbacteria bacterium CG1_02_37_22]PIP32185.1 MAG: hypothetical protein COX23_06145 [Candidatus Gottesmanbacteria bacterium CG23_combo_of_CG06-09_8_20_14_all_37_19]PIR07697.1 MAG: hypothetical protein COV53_06965 [Candidatus Gottesmanbacteria bacterium CG11_big_fil_rev_8_21_14_0_20_37_11]PIZ02972.1 MAG: hypothetical protein COY59_01950 [Candidatus Gottesmanbacteria bacterium CG_4_10_14_0_8_um_filter_37_24]